MVINEISLTGIVELFQNILSINALFKEKGITDGSEMSRVTLTSKPGFLLEQCLVTMNIEDISIFDIDILKSLGTNLRLLEFKPDEVASHKATTPFASFIDLRADHPDTFNMIMRSNAVLDELRRFSEQGNVVARDLEFIGSYKFSAVLTFSGTSILTLFNGFMEKFCYDHFKTVEEVEEKEELILQEIYKNFIELFMKISYQNSNAKGLLEDYLIQKNFFDYTPRAKDVVKLAMITSSSGTIHFFGTNDVEKLNAEIESLKAGRHEGDNYYGYFSVCSSVMTYILLKNFIYCRGEQAKVIAAESLDLLYSNKNIKFNIPTTIQSTHGGRLNIMIKDNIDCRSLILKDPNLSHPAQRYGLIFNGQLIKYVVKVPMNTSSEYFLDRVNFTGSVDSRDPFYKTLFNEAFQLTEKMNVYKQQMNAIINPDEKRL